MGALVEPVPSFSGSHSVRRLEIWGAGGAEALIQILQQASVFFEKSPFVKGIHSAVAAAIIQHKKRQLPGAAAVALVGKTSALTHLAGLCPNSAETTKLLT